MKTLHIKNARHLATLNHTLADLARELTDVVCGYCIQVIGKQLWWLLRFEYPPRLKNWAGGALGSAASRGSPTGGG
jgi:hypothetical protein